MGDWGIQEALKQIFLVGKVFEGIIEWLTDNLGFLFDIISNIIDFILTIFFEFLLIL